ncbi:MAG: DEAD/DEAH box helicase [Candidatus Methanoplasma sp.]|nr:DEAD/DEAH box helicase [Candidatus Methanoplasma sp.]
MISNFKDLGVSDGIIKAMKEMGWTEPTPVQAESIPTGLTGCDMFAQAQTGTGKTGAYGSIALGLTKPGRKDPSVLVLVPTRELANQIYDEMYKLSKYTGHRSAVVYGGVGIEKQIGKLRKGTDIVIATPGRLKDLIGRNEANLSRISMVVLDEADRMLDMGFAKDLNFILGRVPSGRQTLLFSATMSPDVKKLADRMLKTPKDVIVSKDEVTAGLIKQSYIGVTKDTKQKELRMILDSGVSKTIVFCKTKRRVNQLSRNLASDYRVGAIHGDVAQNKRERTVKEFKAGTIEVLIATDIAARGLDIEGVDCAVNYDMPNDPETYMHRIGRTGRAGRDGMSVTFVLDEEKRDFMLVEKHVGMKIPVLDVRSARYEGSAAAKGVSGRNPIS